MPENSLRTTIQRIQIARRKGIEMSWNRDWLERAFLPEQSRVEDFHGIEIKSTLEGNADCFDGGVFAVLKVSGPDTTSYLNGQLSNKVDSLKVGETQLTSLNTPKGKTLAMMHLFRSSKSYYLVMPQTCIEKVHQTLDLYLFAEQVELEILNSHSPLLFLESQKGKLFELLDVEASEVAVSELSGSILFSSTFFERKNACLFLPGEDSLEKLKGANWALGSSCALEEARIRALYPWFPNEYREEKILTPELGQEEIISYNKGCYVGQEVFARIRTYGRTNKVLAGMEFESHEELLGEKIEMDGVSKGAVTSCLKLSDGKQLALGYVPTALKGVDEEVEVNEIEGKIIV